MEAITREEIFLAKIIGETVPDIEPIVRKEMFLARIAGMDIPAIEPITREEMFLNAIANKEVIDLEQITRKELFLAKAMGADIEVPNPITRAEFYLSQMTGGGSGGGTYEKYSWEGVFESIKKGTYATDYAIGDTVPLDLGSEGLINMQIAAFDTDDLADGSGKAPITWISKELLETSHRMSPSIEKTTDDNGATVYTEGTGAIGGWEKSELRTYLRETVKPIIPEDVRNRIKSVKKNQNAFDSTKTEYTQTTDDELWIPSEEDVVGINSVYYALFEDSNENRAKVKADSQKNGAWWLRTCSTYNSSRYITTSGKLSIFTTYSKISIAFGFCT